MNYWVATGAIYSMPDPGMTTYMAAIVATSSTATQATILSAVVVVMTSYLEMKETTSFLATWAMIQFSEAKAMTP